MQIIFSNSQKSLVRKISSKNLWEGLQSLEVKDLKIVDGMGEKQVYRSGNLKIYAEFILAKWIDDTGKERESHFQGLDGYFLQSVVEDLESNGV